MRLRLAGVASDGDDAVRWVSSECPDAIVCDLVMPRLGGSRRSPSCARPGPDSVIVVFSSTPDIAFKAHQLGADAVFDEVTPVGDVLDHVPCCAATVASGQGVRSLLSRSRQDTARASRPRP